MPSPDKVHEPVFHGIRLLPDLTTPRQLFILLHDAGAQSSDLMPLAHALRDIFPDAAFLLPEGFLPGDGGIPGRQWFPDSGTAVETLPARVAAAMPVLLEQVQQAQERYKVLQSDTALIGHAQGAVMALEFSASHDGNVGRVIAFGGRFARLPEKAPQFTTLHLLHGKDDEVVPVGHAYAAYERLAELQGDVTLDIASSVGHELHPALVARAIYRLQTCVPLRSWQRALGSD